MPKVRCNNCETVFASEDDVVHDKAPEDTEGGEFIKGCPKCRTEGYLSDVEKPVIRKKQ